MTAVIHAKGQWHTTDEWLAVGLQGKSALDPDTIIEIDHARNLNCSTLTIICSYLDVLKGLRVAANTERKHLALASCLSLHSKFTSKCSVVSSRPFPMRLAPFLLFSMYTYPSWVSCVVSTKSPGTCKVTQAQ